nr:DUF2634 domain-containing protein [Bacilliculturomica massiliensis]
MLPAADESLKNFYIKDREPGKTYRLAVEKGRFRGFADGVESVKQAIYLILNTERYEYLIYSWNYGLELSDLYGRPTHYVIPELETRIREALDQDDRITGVDDFSFATNKKKIYVTFTVHTIYGDVKAERTVTL